MSQKFKRLYIAFKALKDNWLAGCRRDISLDESFLKWNLKAIGRDANNEMFPIAWAVVEEENKKSWEWFIETLVSDLNLTNEGLGVTIISDQQKKMGLSRNSMWPCSCSDKDREMNLKNTCPHLASLRHGKSATSM